MTGTPHTILLCFFLPLSRSPSPPASAFPIFPSTVISFYPPRQVKEEQQQEELEARGISVSLR